MLWTAPRRVESLSLVSCSSARREARHRSSSVSGHTGMWKPLLSITGLLIIALATWVGAAFWRRSSIRSEALLRVDPKYVGYDVRVPIAPLLQDPLRDDPEVYLVHGDTVVWKIDYQHNAR